MTNVLVDQVREVCADVFGVPLSEVLPASSRADLPMWDSLYHFTLIAALEERFGIFYSSDEIPDMTSVQSIAKATLGHVQQPATRG